MPKYRLLKESAELFPGAIMEPAGSYSGVPIYHIAEGSQHLLKGLKRGSFFYTANVVEDQPDWFVKVQ